MKIRPELRDEFGARVKVGCVFDGASDALAHGTTRREIGAARSTRLQVTQNLVVRFCEEFLGEKRIGYFTKITAFHTRLSHV
ncbi:MAG TPA: hypothetical protein VE422_35680 [Terriglobia bacterium]|nr:hypothetical protein [Terriglobia bacterium]